MDISVVHTSHTSVLFCFLITFVVMIPLQDDDDDGENAYKQDRELFKQERLQGRKFDRQL